MATQTIYKGAAEAEVALSAAAREDGKFGKQDRAAIDNAVDMLFPKPEGYVSRKAARTAAQGSKKTGLDSTEEGLTSGLASLAGNAPNYKAILAAKTEHANAMIDTLREQFNGVIAGENKLGESRNKRTRALNLSGNLQGSDFASGAAQRTEDYNAAIIAQKESERDAKINEILSGIPGQADDAYARASEVYRTNAEAGLTAIKNFRETQRSTASTNLAAIAASGASFDAVQNSPNYSRLLEAFGGDDNALKGAFLASVPAKNKLGSTTVGNKFITFMEDPTTGKTSTIEFTLPQNLGAEETVQQVFSNGQVAIKSTSYDANGNKKESIRIESAGGQARPSTTADPNKNYTATNIPNDVRSDLLADIKDEKNTLADVYEAYPDVSSAYISSTFNSLRKKKEEGAMDDTEFLKSLEAMIGGK